MKLTYTAIILLVLSGCTAVNPPAPKKASGAWKPLTTSVEDIKAKTL